MARIDIIGGEKGGVGKSLFCRSLLHYWLGHLDRFDNRKPMLFDTDKSNQDVLSVYDREVESQDAYFSEDSEALISADLIFNTALYGSPVIVNLKAAVYGVVRDWIERNGLVELGEMAGDPTAREGNPIFEDLSSSPPKKGNKDPNQPPPEAWGGKDKAKMEQVRFVHWFVCSGQPDSVDHFLSSLSDLGRAIPHVLVQNQWFGTREQWQSVRGDLQREVDEHNVAVVEMPALLKTDCQELLAKKLTFHRAIRDLRLPMMQRQRIYLFCQHLDAQLQQAFEHLRSRND